MTAKLGTRLLVVLGFAGLFVASILSLADALNKNVPCGSSGGCETVAAWAAKIGIPNAYLGLAGYVLLTVFALQIVIGGFDAKSGVFRAGFLLSAVGAIYSIGLQVVSKLVIHAICFWCLGSAVIMIATFVTYFMLSKKREPEPAALNRGSYLTIAISAVIALTAGGVVANNMSGHLAGTNLTPLQISPDQMKQLVTDATHVINPNGKVTIVEFGDLVCPICRHWYPQIEGIAKNSNGKIRFVFHHFPLVQNEEHVNALPGAVIAEIAQEKSPDAFWSFINSCYTGDDKAPMPDKDQMIQMAQAIGLDASSIQSRLANADNDPALSRVRADMALGNALGISETPTYVVIIPGKPPVATLANGVQKIFQEPAVQAIVNGNS